MIAVWYKLYPVCVRAIYNALTSIKSYILDRHSLIIILQCQLQYLLCIIPIHVMYIEIVVFLLSLIIRKFNFAIVNWTVLSVSLPRIFLTSCGAMFL